MLEQEQRERKVIPKRKGIVIIMEERLKKQLDFALEIDKEKNIYRQTHLSGHGRNENDAEHAWHMAIMAYLLREYANEEVDITKVMLMCLIHDIVEIEAGDTYAYDTENLQPLILNDSNDGGDWKEHGVTAEQVYGRQRKTRLGSEKLFEEVTDHIIRKHIEKGNLKEQ